MNKISFDVMKQKGQTLIEIVVVTGIMMVLLVGLMQAVTASVARNRQAKDQAVATRLAQAGVEWIRQERDERIWPLFKNIVTTTPGVHRFCLRDSTADLTSVPTRNCYTAEAVTSVSGSVFTTDFFRNIELTYVAASDYYDLVVRVSWNTNDEVVLSSRLYGIR